MFFSYFAFAVKKSIASPTVVMLSALSSGISVPKAFSNSMINSTVSRESAPKSLVKLASRVTSDSSTPSFSTMIAFTFSSTSAVEITLKI